MNKHECIIIAPTEGESLAPFHLLTRKVFPSYEAASSYLDHNDTPDAQIVECYYGTNLRQAKLRDYKKGTQMTREYTQITKKEMEEFLGVQANGQPDPDSDWNFYRIELPVKQLVYGRLVAQNITLRIYSSIDEEVSRECGEDPIRCKLYYRKEDGTIVHVGKTRNVLRINTWKNNLKKQINDWQKHLGPMCPKCSAPMREKTNRANKSKFLGCINYPECNGTRAA